MVTIQWGVGIKYTKNIHNYFKMNLYSVPFLECTCSVPSPYFLRAEVLLSEECTEQVHPGCGSGIISAAMKK